MLLGQVEAHLRRTGMPPTLFGRKAAGDPWLVRDMRRGRQVGARLAARIRAYLSVHAL